MIVISDINGNVIRKSANLRGLLDHARRTPVETVELTRKPAGAAMVRVNFYNGDWAVASFGSATVAHNWIMSRRSWCLALLQTTKTSEVFTCFLDREEEEANWCSTLERLSDQIIH